MFCNDVPGDVPVSKSQSMGLKLGRIERDLLHTQSRDCRTVQISHNEYLFKPTDTKKKQQKFYLRTIIAP